MTRVPLVQLIDSESAPNDFLRTGDGRTFADLIGPAGLREIATYAHVLAPHKDLVIPRTVAGCLGEPTRLVDHAHRVGLAVQVWTFRAERRFLPSGADFPTELSRFAGLGIQGLFSDHPDQAVAALRKPAMKV
jgi:glycerophosphoryl diester phosphodiesterase